MRFDCSPEYTQALPSSPAIHSVNSVKEELKMKVTKNMRRVSEESMVYPGCIKKERDDLTAAADDEENNAGDEREIRLLQRNVDTSGRKP